MVTYSFRFLIVLILLGSASVWAQERILSAEEFNRIQGAADRLSYVAPYRVRMQSEHFENGSPNASMSVSEISETQSDDRRRNLRRTTVRGVEKKVETVTVGKASFERIDDGPWTRQKEDDAPRFGGMFTELPLKKTESRFRYVGKDLVMGIDAEFYESTVFREYDRLAYTIVNRFWVHANGKLLKKETHTIESDGTLSFRMSTFYDYPTNLVIREPIK